MLEASTFTVPLIMVADIVWACSFVGGLIMVVPAIEIGEVPLLKAWKVMVARIPLPLTPVADRSTSATPWMYPWLLDIGEELGLHVKSVVPESARNGPSETCVRFMI